MKKLLTLLALAVVFAGCSKDDYTSDKNAGVPMQTVRLGAGIVSGEDTKAAISSEDGSFTWQENDQISVLATDGKFYTLTLVDGKDTKEAEFKGSIPQGYVLTGVAIYPATVADGAENTVYDASTGILNYTVPSEYTWVKNSTNVPMVAKLEEGASEASFKQIGSVIRFTFNGMPAKAKVVFTAKNLNVTGGFEIDVEKAGTSVIQAASTEGSNSTVTVNYDVESAGACAEINIPVPTGRYDAFSVEVFDAENNSLLKKDYTPEKTLNRATLLMMKTLDAGPIVISEVWPYFVDARVMWQKFTGTTQYALYVDDSDEPIIVDDTTEGDVAEAVFGGEFDHKSTHKVAVAKVVAGEPVEATKSSYVEFTTGNIRQITYNTGTKFICAGWDDVAVGPEYGTYFSNGKWNKIIEVAGKSDHSVRAYQIQLYKEDKKTLLYDEIPFDGQESGMSPFISGNYWGRIASASCLYPTSLSLGWLEPDTKYYFRVRTLAESVVMNSDNGNFKDEITLKSARGGSAWSDFVEMKTDAEYVMSDWDVLYEGFDDMLYNSDIGNMSAAAVPLLRTTNSAAYKERHEGQLSEWIKKDLANREFSEQEVNVFLSPYQLGLTDDSYTDATTPRTFNALAGSLEGWSVLSTKTDYDAYPDFGLLRIGQNINSKAGCAEIRTAPIASDKLSADKEKACFVTIHVSPAQGTYITPKKVVLISQYRNGSIIAQKTTDYTLNGDGSVREEWNVNYVQPARTDYERTPIWFEVTETFNLMNGDVISISTTNVDRGFVMLSDIKITIDKDASSDSDETRFYGTAPDNTNYDVWGLNGSMPVTFWMGPPALDQFNAETMDEAGLQTLKTTYFDPIVQGGYNLIEISNPYPSSMKVLLQWCQESGVKLTDKSIGAWNDPQGNVTRISQYADNNAYAGLFVGRDEPGYIHFDDIAAMNNAFMSSLSTKARTVNLFPSYATVDQFNYSSSSLSDGNRYVSNFVEYVAAFINKMNVTDRKFNLMFDHYCLKKSGNDGSVSRGNVKSTQYYDLDVIRHYTLEKRIPFLQITHGRPAWEAGYGANASATAPTVEKLTSHVYDEQRWLVWSQLALGSKGVSYFCYWTPDGFTGGPFSWTYDGEQTRMYGILKNINTEIQPIGKVLMKCHADGAIMTGPFNNFVLYENDGNGLTNYGPVLSLQKGNFEDVIAGCFRDASTGEYKVLVTHKAPAGSDYEAGLASIANLTIDTSMSTEVKLHTVTLNNGHDAAATTVVSTVDVSGGTLTLNIPDGTAVLVEFPETANVNYN